MGNRYATKLLKTLVFTLLLAGPQLLFAQLAINNSQTAQQLVQNVLLGQGVTATNITFSGQPLQIASFSTTATNLGLGSGVIMSTGECAIAVGPNDNSGHTLPTGGFNGPGDPDLDNISSAGTFDAAVLEFDFIPTSDSIKFRYVFGSEEYLEFVNAGFNDVFAFILSGITTPMAPTNIALVPNTNIPVSIDNINNVSFPQYYIDNGDGSTPAGTTIQFDGFTAVLTARAAVICGETYHIKLAIADAGDPILDSGVFLEAGSFSSVGAVNIITDVSYSSTNDSTIAEGCGSAAIGFIRNGDLSQPYTVNYTLQGTATNGVDYNNLNGQFVIPAGQDTGYITLTSIDDGVAEGTETIVIVVTTLICNTVTTDTATIFLNDRVPLNADAGLDQSTACTNGQPVQLTVNATGGVEPYTYLWSTNESTQSIAVLPANTTAYTITVTDVCNMQDADTVAVAVEQPQPLTVTAANDTTICQNSTANLWANAQGGNGGITLSWNTGQNGANITVAPDITTTYTVTATDVCNQTATEDVTVTVLPNNAAFDYLALDENNVSFDNHSAGYENGVWWNFGDSATSTAFAPQHQYPGPGTYTVTLVVENSAGCLDTVQYNIIIRPGFYIYIPNAFTPNNDGINEDFNAKGTGFDIFDMSIYNRWGEQLFNTQSLARGWDGKYGGSFVPVGVYTYVVNVKVTAAQKDYFVYRGRVAVVR